ncbi:hypothetical protein [Bacillus sonorensis]|uniref:hypothetical protein n=1 Tax=Bacillus sonorensis TaxID=119858 RepID=UPI002DB784A2|nr:hypothetical protein [Bacillus sonorensis]MEC0342575.1 hypothetical protein [Bacillus sonorensis]MEC0457464.1 hypothetical protein [Bacillus sonorensis]MEC0530741.1 hypothetical protein [Bacillus sonorensis]
MKSRNKQIDMLEVEIAVQELLDETFNYPDPSTGLYALREFTQSYAELINNDSANFKDFQVIEWKPDCVKLRVFGNQTVDIEYKDEFWQIKGGVH